METETVASEITEPPGRTYALAAMVPAETAGDLDDRDLRALKNPFDGLDFIKQEKEDGGIRTAVFRKQHYPEVTDREWNDWRWQLRNRLTSEEKLGAILNLSGQEKEAFRRCGKGFPASVTPYYASLLDPDDPSDALRRCVIPVSGEFASSPGEADDPLGEDGHSPVPGIVHRYPDRVLFLATDFCSTYCRYCTRSRRVGRVVHERFLLRRWELALDYIASRPEVRDVIVSGGDPLTLDNAKLDWLLSRLRAIQHVEVIRIGTKVPAVLPQRVTPALVRMLRRHHPLYISIHFTHPRELTPETARACNMLADAGMPLGSQTVLLAGINDSVETMKSLMRGLMKIRVRPYYLYQCDPISGSAHFRTPVEKGLEIIKGLRGHTSGYAVPNYVIDAPGGGGKVPMLPQYAMGRDEGGVVLKNYEGKLYHYPDFGNGIQQACDDAGRH